MISIDVARLYRTFETEKWAALLHLLFFHPFEDVRQILNEFHA